MSIGSVAPPSGGDVSVDPPRKLQKATKAGSFREPRVTSRPHGKDAGPLKPAPKRAADAQPERGKTTVKRAR